MSSLLRLVLLCGGGGGGGGGVVLLCRGVTAVVVLDCHVVVAVGVVWLWW